MVRSGVEGKGRGCGLATRGKTKNDRRACDWTELMLANGFVSLKRKREKKKRLSLLLCCVVLCCVVHHQFTLSMSCLTLYCLALSCVDPVLKRTKSGDHPFSLFPFSFHPINRHPTVTFSGANQPNHNHNITPLTVPTKKYKEPYTNTVLWLPRGAAARSLTHCPHPNRSPSGKNLTHTLPPCCM